MPAKLFVYIKIILLITASAELHSVYDICKKYSKPGCERIFLWNKEQINFFSLFNLPLILDEPQYDTNLIRETVVRVIADNMLPYITSSNYSQKLGGFLGDVWQLIENTLGFKSNVSSVYYDTGLELITSEKADVMLAAVVPKSGLLNAKYSQPYFSNWYHLFIKMPKARASSLSYIKTFDAKLWFTTLGVFTVLAITLWTTTKLLKERTTSVPSCFLGVISGVINQGFDLKLFSYSGRIQVMFALILGVVLYSAMNAVLVSQLAVFDIPFPFKSVDDIADRSTHSLCLRSNSFVYNNFTDNNKTILPGWRKTLNQPPCLDITSQANLAEILCDDRIVVLENRVVMKMILKNYNISCNVMNSHVRLFETGNSFLMGKGFVYKELINEMLLKMTSIGILKRLEYIWIRGTSLMDKVAPSRAPQITLDHIEGLLAMYSAVILISILIMVIEILLHKYTHRKKLGNYIN